jgi:dTMP kinase
MKSIGKGILITVDGPNGVGKSSIVNNLANQLSSFGQNVLKTKEPTPSFLGNFVRKAEERCKGFTLALLVAADRQFHVKREILPSLRENKIVISDRHIESSLVLQGLDGISFHRTWAINKFFPIPDLSIILIASKEILEKRLSVRNRFSRFERTKGRQKEIDMYLKAAEFLARKNFNVCVMKNEKIPLQEKCKENYSKNFLISR